ncbi:Tryptophan synthase alpha chain [bacterium HR17]|jgi:tryptophan synthase alpha chain|uniref:Tryptophan synthase alpha chain n=1 Tax=Candidatus Fervidibacter japonicus TaxID=2035412 RepID=A0A2H5XFT5_9BACT|nr:Tryptophan synthase alpha chain [bacterium HR17]
MERLHRCFERLREQKTLALVLYVTAGDPSPEQTVEAVLRGTEAGADVFELGIPFSDPIADGPTIQAAIDRALRRGVRVATVLEMVHAIRQHSQVPLVLMTYFNPIWRYGLERFASDAAKAGADGVLLTDVPPEEAGEWLSIARRVNLATIFLLAPTSTEQRIRLVAEIGTGFIYCVSRTGVTGEREALPPDLPDLVRRIRAHTDKPIVIGFGISRPDHVAVVASMDGADGVVVGSALVRLLHEEFGDGRNGNWQRVTEFVRALKAAGMRRR